MQTPVERTAEPAPAWSEERVTRLVRGLQRPLEAYLAALGCPRARIPDLVQDGFLALLRTGLGTRDEGATAAYLRRIVRNAYFKSLRRAPEAREGGALDLDALEAAWAEYERDDGGSAYLTALRACLERLSERECTALELQYGHGLARAEIATRLALSEGGLKSLLAAGKERLRACIQRRLA